MSTKTAIFGFTRPSSDDYAHMLGDDMGATVDALEALLYGMGVRVAPDATALAAEVTARQALAARVAVPETRVTVTSTAAAGQPISGNATTALVFGQASPASTAGMWSNGAPTRLVVPATGEYDLTVNVQWAVSPNVGGLVAGYRINGGAPVWCDSRPSQTWFDSWVAAPIRGLQLTAGQYLEAIVTQNSDPSRVIRVGATATLARAR